MRCLCAPMWEGRRAPAAPAQVLMRSAARRVMSTQYRAAKPAGAHPPAAGWGRVQLRPFPGGPPVPLKGPHLLSVQQCGLGRNMAPRSVAVGAAVLARSRQGNAARSGLGRQHAAATNHTYYQKCLPCVWRPAALLLAAMPHHPLAACTARRRTWPAAFEV